MKTKQLTGMVFLILMLSGCYIDDDSRHYPSHYNVPQYNTIAGRWNLVNVSGGIAGINDSFANGTIIWNFNESNNTVTVTNNNTNPQAQDILESGTYAYTFEANNATPELCSETIRIGFMNLGCYNLTGSQFTMTQIETDGFTIRLER